MGDLTRALLCDFDGTLADSLGLLRQVYEVFLGRFGANPTMEEFNSLNGPPLAEVVATLRKNHDLPLGQEEAVALYNSEIAAAWPRLMPTHGARTLLEAARDAGWRVAVVTSNDRVRVEAWLEGAGLASLVDCVIGGDVKPGKPRPEPYLAALRKLACRAQDAIAIEDAVLGYQSAVGAGVRTLFYAPADRPAGPPGAERLLSLPEACRLFQPRREQR